MSRQTHAAGIGAPAVWLRPKINPGAGSPRFYALAVAAARKIYAEIGAVLRARRCDVASGRAVVATGRKLRLASAAVADGVADLPRRGSRALVRGTAFAPPSAVLAFSDMARV